MRTPIAVILLPLLLGPALTSSAGAASFDCRAAVQPADRTVCDDPNLSAKDDEFAALDRQIRAALRNNYSDLRSFTTDARRWLSMKMICRADTSCLNAWYDERIAYYDGLLGAKPSDNNPTPPAPRYDPTPNPTPSPTIRPLAPGTQAVAMDREGGTYVVPVTINGVMVLKFVVDSGAADVSIPADVVMTLIRTETLTKADFIGQQTYRMADGSTVPSATFRIRSLKVGDVEVQNVMGSVASVNGDLLLGQSFLGRLKTWSIDNSRHALILE